MKRESIVDYHECYLWSIDKMAVPEEDRQRKGNFSASGEYLWFALSDGVDEHRHEHPCLDLRKKVYTSPVGSSSHYEFMALKAANGPSLFLRCYPCRCESCRMNPLSCPHSVFVGFPMKHDTPFQTCTDMASTQAAQRNQREQGRVRQAHRVNLLRQAQGMEPLNVEQGNSATTAARSAPEQTAVPAQIAPLGPANEDSRLADLDPLGLVDMNFYEAALDAQANLADFLTQNPPVPGAGQAAAGDG